MTHGGWRVKGVSYRAVVYVSTGLDECAPGNLLSNLRC
jgi:hypothetical protein